VLRPFEKETWNADNLYWIAEKLTLEKAWTVENESGNHPDGYF
jgi:hypothetical protein